MFKSRISLGDIFKKKIVKSEGFGEKIKGGFGVVYRRGVQTCCILRKKLIESFYFQFHRVN